MYHKALLEPCSSAADRPQQPRSGPCSSAASLPPVPLAWVTLRPNLASSAGSDTSLFSHTTLCRCGLVALCEIISI